MDAMPLAQELRKLHFKNAGLFEWRPGLPPLEHHAIADAGICIDALAKGGFPSSNRNRVQFLGVEQTVEPRHLDEIIQLYRSRNIGRFYFWLSPGPQSEEIAEWLQQRGLEIFGGTGYPVLARTARPPEPRDTELTVRRIGAAEAPALLANKGAAVLGEDPATSSFMRSLGQENIDHFLAFDGDDIAATAMLQVNGNFAYLLNAGTLEMHRGRGGQSALIQARIQRALERGCTTLASETLYMLHSSLGNLQRAGFDIIYDKQVWVWDGE